MRLHIVTRSPVTGQEHPVRAEIVWLRGTSRSPRERESLGWTNGLGFTSELPKQWKALLICPAENHWCTLVRRADLKGTNTVSLQPYSDEIPWWSRKQLLLKKSVSIGNRIKIGIIDLGFPESFSKYLNNFRVSKAWPLLKVQDDALLDRKSRYHGFVVSSILASKPVGEFRGVGCDAEVYFANVSSDKYPHSPDKSRPDIQKVIAAIEAMVREHSVNIINISCGFELSPDRDEDFYRIRALQRRVAWAFENGAICICAAGNDPNKPIVYPAMLKDAIGVGGVGPSGLGPENSYLSHCEKRAQAANKVSHETVEDVRFFLDPYTSRGKGLDCVAPSVGINVPFHSSTSIGHHGATLELPIFEEFDGTSFSAPIVVSRLACTLEADSVYLSETQPKRKSEYALERLRKVCHNLGFGLVDVGAGFPCLV